MDRTDDAPRFRGFWAAPTALVATVAMATVIILLELVAVAIFMGASDPVAVARDIPVWVIMPVFGIVLTGVSLFGMPTWAVLHALGAVHPAQGGLIGGLVGGLITAFAMMLVASGPGAVFLGLFGVLPGACSGAFGLWVAYAPKTTA